MSEPRFTLCRAEFLLPLAAPDRGARIHDGYILSAGETIAEVGPWTSDTGRRPACGPAPRGSSPG